MKINNINIMKKNSIKYAKFLLALSMILSVVSCQLDYENTNAINPDDVWNDPVMIRAYVSDIHGSMMPGWPVNGNSSDEAINSPADMSDYLRGIIDVTSTTGGQFNYTNIDKINFFLEKMPTIPSSVMSEADKNLLIGQMLFWRAWDYWSKIQSIGGVPLITKVQNVKDNASLFVPRNKTSECMTQIIADLDQAIAKLPPTWTGGDYGRIDKCAAAAFKGKVLTWYASPLFNPSNDAGRWQTAYTATKAAVDICVAAGKGLRPKYADIWQVERNEEVIMVNQFYYSDHAFGNAGVRPECITVGASNQNQPLLSLISAYPKKDGTQLNVNTAQIGNDVYDQQLMTDLYANMDDRFYATVFSPGTVYPSKDDILSGGKRLYTTWRNTGAPAYNSTMISDELTKGLGGSVTTGFYAKKGVDPGLTSNTIDQAGLDWVEIRFAEVLMNYGECANETGKTTEAIDVLKKIRARAGITGVNYGITATTQVEIREAYIKERFVEFALEGKRFGDLRRWKRYDILNTRLLRDGIKIVIKDNTELINKTFDWTQDMSNAATRAKFKLVYYPCINDNPTIHRYALKLDHWFYAIHKNDIDRNAKIEQNNEWGGTFDPLK
jgi:hypothetical protein